MIRLLILMCMAGVCWTTSPCCNTCLSLRVTNTIEICDNFYNSFFYCNPTCRLWSATIDGYDGIDRDKIVRVYGCEDCPSGHYRDLLTTQCYCEACTTHTNFRCMPDAGWYISTPCGPNNNRVCSRCDTCGLGTYTSACTDFSLTCATCLSGTYRSELANQACSPCKQCSLQQRQRRTACGPIYDRTCETCPEGSIVTGADLNVCSACPDGKFARASDNTCATCTACARTEKQKTGCLATADRTCELCGNYGYTLALNAVTCAGCIETRFSSGANSCPVCAESSCGNGNYRTCSYTPEAGGVRTCKACQGQSEDPKCDPGYGVTVRCDGQGTEMVSCAVCGAGKHRPAGTGLVGYKQTCMSCDLGYYKSAAGSGSCGACTNKPASNTQYITWGTTLPSSNTCFW